MQKHDTEEARWKEIFLILFPDVDPDAFPSPCRLFIPHSSLKS